MMNMQNVKSLFLVSLLSGAFTLGGYKLFIENSNKSIVTSAPNYSLPVGLAPEGIDFTVAAEKAVHSVVHVKMFLLLLTQTHGHPFLW